LRKKGKQYSGGLLDAVGGGQDPATFDDAGAADGHPLIGRAAEEALEVAHVWPRVGACLPSTDNA